MFLLSVSNTFQTTMLAIMLVLTACGCFIVGINLMSRGFVRASVDSENFFTRGFASKNRFGGIFYGFAFTAISQSSDVTTVTLVRLGDLGVITLFQACACVIGANIGTTITTFIVSLSALNLTPYFAFLAFVGAIPLLSKKKTFRIFGEIVAGFGVLFIGLQLLDTSLQSDSIRSLVHTIFNTTTNPFLLIPIAVLLACVVQSSSVVTSMVVFLVASSLLPMESALCLVVGANIGTCFTSWIASLGASKTARQIALFHTSFNVIGEIMFLIMFFSPLKTPFFNFINSVPLNSELKVALFHFFFNVCAAIVMIPFLRPVSWVCKKIVRH